MTIIKHRFAYSARNCHLQISCRISSAMFDIPPEILQSPPFLIHKSSKRRVANGAESNRLILFWLIKEIVEQGLRQLFITCTSLHYF